MRSQLTEFDDVEEANRRCIDELLWRSEEVSSLVIQRKFHLHYFN